MPHLASRIAVAHILSATALTIFVTFGSKTARAEYADFVEPLLKAKTATFAMVVRTAGKDISPAAKMFVSGPGTRMELANGDIRITDDAKHVSLVLNPQTKQMAIVRTVGTTPGAGPQGLFAELRTFLAPSNKEKGMTREPLGEKPIEGRKLVGYSVTSPKKSIEIWGDPQTLMPQLFVEREAEFPAIETRFYDFKFDVNLDPALFSVDPAPGYKVSEQTYDVSLETEEDLTKALHGYATLSGGVFPEALNSETLSVAIKKSAERLGPGPWKKAEQDAAINAVQAMRRGFAFSLSLGPAADGHYAGKGVKIGTKDRPIFWYKPKGAKNFRVLYADLTMKEFDNPPNVSAAVKIENSNAAPNPPPSH